MIFTDREIQRGECCAGVLRLLLIGLLLVLALSAQSGCSAAKMSQEDIIMMRQQVELSVKSAQDLGLDANAFLWLELGEDIGAWKTAITGPLKMRAFVQITARPESGVE